MGIEVVKVKPGVPEWVLGIIKYIDANEVPNDKCEARNIRNKAAHYTLVKGVLYRRGYSTPLLRCISFEKAQYVLAEVHERICSDNSRGKMLAGKVMRAEYYWPRALWDAKEYVRNCKKCQEYSKVPHCPSEELTSRGVRFEAVAVAVEYFTKCIEAEALATITMGTTTRDEGKLGPQWESPYVVTVNNRSGSYWLRDSQENELPPREVKSRSAIAPATENGSNLSAT
ncbi:uncharacterized protein LOC121242153 [Juglans microcarpa x Juglans regia]|uniref:uncharacterized protein LOC121242153 n=1 Tax=Juglans microcarpa x Juglans regia TaxID=2249226 RepID=UPI001B7DB921|nr:uncharacterized protein LOC121242153 [Juglans microcarpa x Juglans regia]